MIHKYIKVIFVFLFSTMLVSAQEFELYNDVPVEAKRIVFKYAPSLKSFSVTAPDSPQQSQQIQIFETILQQIQATEPHQLFPVSRMPDSCKNCVDISRIYEFYYSADIPISQALAMLRNCAVIEYAEPVYLEHELFVPNDPELAQQWHMNTCRVYQAWDVEVGDTSVVIGITDSGFEISHLDLLNQIKYNYADPINGQDDDYDGYTDNFRGWDFGNKDNNPSAATSDHGTWVSGISNAQVNNSFAMAGVAYNCKFIPIKVATDQGLITRGYEGIVYAANQNCDIINCSWGSVGSYSEFALDIINYATYNCNALVIGAAGNSNNTGIFYPASYTNVISVGGSDLGDVKWTGSTTGSNWNYYVDVIAPARGYRTLNKNNGTIATSGGTSFAAPIVSGIAALVKSAHPTISALELGERIRATADDIYGIESNQQYLHLLGSGRVNALKAIVDSTTPSVRMLDFSVENKNGSYKFFPGDTLLLTVTFKNYLADATNIFVSVSCENSFIAPIQASELFPTFNHNEEKTTTTALSFEIVQTLPADVQTMFKITYTADSYFGFEYFPVLFNPSYYDFEIGNFAATATANGTIGVLTPSRRVENGIVYKNNPCMLYEGSLLIEKPNEKVAARVREQYGFTIQDFPIVRTADSVDILIESSYFNSNMNLNVVQYIYGWDDVDALVHEYRISHTTDSVYHAIRVGAYIDWVIVAQTYNKMNYIDSLQLGYAYSIDPWGYYTGILPLHYHQTNFYAVDDGVGLDSIYIANGFSDDEIRYGMNNSKYSAGNFIDGGTVSSISGAFIPELHPDSTAIVRYAIIASETLQGLVETAQNLRANYLIDTTTSTAIEGTTHTQIRSNYYNTTIYISFPPQQSRTHISLYNSMGIRVYETTISAHVGGPIHIDCSDFANGIYIISFENLQTKYIEKIHVHK